HLDQMVVLERRRGGRGRGRDRNRGAAREQHRAAAARHHRHAEGPVRRLVFALALLSGCTTYRTQIMGGVLSDFVIPRDLPLRDTFTLRFTASRSGVPLFRSFRCITNEADIPGSLGIYSTTPIDAEVELAIEGYQVSGGCDPEEDPVAPPFVTRKSTLSLVSEQ